MTCDYCDVAAGKGKGQILYQTDTVIVAIKDMAVTPGQITVFPKQHGTIMEMIPDEVLQECSLIANKVSIAVFEGLGAQGTNLMVQNGIAAGQTIPHFAIEIIPRQENDGLALTWAGKQVMEDEMERTLTALTDALNAKEEKKEEKPSKESPKEQGDNYMIKQLRRLP